MYNPEKVTTLGMQQDIRRRQTQNVQSRDTENIGYITRHKRKTNTDMYNPEKLTTLGIQQDIRGRQFRMYNPEKLTTLVYNKK